MKKYWVLDKRVILAVVSVTILLFAVGCEPVIVNQSDASGQNLTDPAPGGQPTNSVENPVGDDKGTPEVSETPGAEASGTPQASAGHELVGTIESISANTITVNGVVYTLADPTLISGLKVGDMIKIEVEVEDNRVVVSIHEAGDDDHDGTQTPEATDDHGLQSTQTPIGSSPVVVTAQATVTTSSSDNSGNDDHGGDDSSNDRDEKDDD